MLKNFCVNYLRRRGYLVIRDEVPMIVLSGNAYASASNYGCDWSVYFPVKPAVVTINGSIVNSTTPSILTSPKE